MSLIYNFECSKCGLHAGTDFGRVAKKYTSKEIRCHCGGLYMEVSQAEIESAEAGVAAINKANTKTSAKKGKKHASKK